MATRRTIDDSDSLELLLDTICNVFGGVIFIAMLVAVLTSFRASSVQETVESQSLPNLPREAGLRRAISQYSIANSALREDVELLATPETVSNAAVMATLEQRLVEAQTYEHELRAWLAEQQRVEELQAEEAEAALIALGYKPQEAAKAISKVAEEGMTSETLIRLALRNMIPA